MKNVKPGDVLHFTKAKEPEPVQELHMRRLSKAKISQGKALVMLQNPGIVCGIVRCQTRFGIGEGSLGGPAC